LVCCLWFVVRGWLSGVAPRHSRRPDSPFRRLSISPVSPSLRLFPPSIHRHHPQRGHPPRHEHILTPSTTNPLRLAGSPSPLPVLLLLEKGRGDMRLGSRERFRTPTSPRLAVSPSLQVTTSSFPPFIDSPALPPTGPPSHATSTTSTPSTTKPLCISVSPNRRLFPSSIHRHPVQRGRPPPAPPRTSRSPSTQYPIPNPHPPICAKSPERYRAPAHRWWGRAGGMIV
jgi:hypothetical protein